MLKEMALELAIYIITYSMLAFLCYALSKRIKNKKIASILIVAICVIYASIRYNVGPDYDTYLKQYNHIRDYFSSVGQILSSDFQFGFNLLEFLTKTIFQNKYAIFAVVALIVYPLKFRILRKTSNNFSESVLLFFLLGFHIVSLNLLKQEIAMTLFLVAYYYFISSNKKIWRKVLAVAFLFIGATFHISSILPVLIMIVAKAAKPTKLKITIALLVSVVLAINYSRIVASIPFFERYVRYTEDINYDYYIVIIGAIGYCLMNLLILWLLFRKRNELCEISERNSFIISALICSIPFKILGIVNFPVYRLSLYIDQLLLIIIPDLLRIYKKGNNNYRSEYALYFAVIYLFFVFSIVFLAYNNFYTYQTIFEIEGGL